jgi:SAM-dependent methyltransferase
LYQKKHSFVFEYGSSLVDIASPRPGETILDIGCGTGELTYQLFSAATQGIVPTTSDSSAAADSALRVVGIDADKNMILNAQGQYPSVKFLTVDIRSMFDVEEQARMEEEKIPKTFDLIFSNAALHWIPSNDIDNVVNSISQLMNADGGRLVIEFGGKGNLNAIVTACQDVLSEQYGIKGFVSPWYFPSIGEFSAILERHGIDVVSAALFDRPTKLTDPVNGMIDWLRMFGQAFIEAALTAYDTNNGTVSSDTVQAVSRQDKELLFVTAVNERLRSKLYDGTQWIADYRRIRIVGYRR